MAVNNAPYYISAYGIAVKHGFSGSEEEWIAFVEANGRDAQTAAEAAEIARELAESAAAAAVASAGEVAAFAETAVQAANEAADSATVAQNASASAAESAAQAETAGQTAQTAAELAAIASSNAADSAAQAETARQGAYVSMTAAEDAAGAALSAQSAAESASSGAASAFAGAVDAKDAALSAQSAAETAANGVIAAQTAAESAANAAADSADSAEECAYDSEAWAVGERGGLPVEPDDPAFQNNAKWYKEQASSIVGGDFLTGPEAQGYVDTHNTAENAHADLFQALREELSGSNTGGVVFSQTRPTGNWTLWLQDLGEVPDYPDGEPVIPQVPVPLDTAPLDAPGDFAVMYGENDGETVLNMTDNPETAGDDDIVIVED